MVSRKVSRRRFVASTAAASTALVAAPFVRGAYAAGKLSLGLWDHWVPGANKATEEVIKTWADKEKVEVTIDFITSQGNKLLLTTAAEAQAKSGHDILAFSTWLPARYAEQLVPMNDVIEPLIKQNGAGQRHRRVSRQGRRQVAGGAGDRRQPDQGSVLAHRPPEAARRHRRPGDVSGRRAAQGRRLDPRRLPQGGRGLPEGRPPVRHRSRHDRRTASTPPARSSTASAPCWSTPRATSRSRATRSARRSTTTRS